MTTLSIEYDDPKPWWGLVDGLTSFFDHESNHIYFARGSLDLVIRTGDEVDFVGLVAHEFWHYHQHENNINQDKPHIREINARRFAKQYISKIFPNRLNEFNFQPITASDEDAPVELGIDKITTPEELISLSNRALTPGEVKAVEQSYKPRGRPISTSLYIRHRLIFQPPEESLVDWPYGLWDDFRHLLKAFNYKPPKYDTFRTMMWVMNNKLGLIRRVHVDGKPIETESEFGPCCPRHPYEIVLSKKDHPAWKSPMKFAYKFVSKEESGLPFRTIPPKLKKRELTNKEKVLLLFGNEEETRVSDLSRISGLSKSRISTFLKEFREKGFIVKVPKKKGRWMITDEGLSEVKKIK